MSTPGGINQDGQVTDMKENLEMMQELVMGHTTLQMERKQSTLQLKFKIKEFVMGLVYSMLLILSIM